ncbi:CBS domain-containing protein [Chloroflexota bacterium]
MTALPPEKAAEILEYLDPEEVVKVTTGIKSELLSDILDEADSDVQADILRQLPDEQAEEVLKEMEKTETVFPLLQYDDDSAGGRMVLEYVIVRGDSTIADALNELREHQPELEDVRSIFVSDNSKRLVREIGLTRLALSRPRTLVNSIMNTDIIYVSCDTDQEECIRVMERYNLDLLPVVNEEMQLIGVIQSEHVFDPLGVSIKKSASMVIA